MTTKDAAAPYSWEDGAWECGGLGGPGVRWAAWVVTGSFAPLSLIFFPSNQPNDAQPLGAGKE